jgi:TPP-dependent 2-oxoacid decarboxylase
MGLAFAQLPRGARFDNQTLWGAIGWATPAAFGAAVAAPDRRVLLFTGEGSHQLTAQEISQFHRQGLRPIVFVLNNSGISSSGFCARIQRSHTTMSPPGITPSCHTRWAATTGSPPR